MFTDDATAEALTPSLDWLNPFAAGGAALTSGFLLGVFATGWESAVNLTEETTDSAIAPGKAAILSTVLLLVTYVSVAYAIVAYMGTDFLTENADEEEFIFGLVATEVLGAWDWILLSRSPPRRSRRRRRRSSPPRARRFDGAAPALPHTFAHIHHRFRTPDVSTWWVAVIASVWYVVINLVSENALFDSLTALSLLIAFYYALTGIACAVYYRRHLTESIEQLLPDRRRPGRRRGAARLAARGVDPRHVRRRRTPTAGRRGSASGRRS